MARTLSKKTPKKKAPKAAKPRAKKANGEAEGTSRLSNAIIPNKELKAAFARLDRLFDAKETANAEHMADIKQAYQDIASELGVPRKILRHVYGEKRHQDKLAQREAEFEAGEKDEADRLMAAAVSFGDTPFGRFAAAQAGRVKEESESADDGAIEE